jgi:hypothetical protein
MRTDNFKIVPEFKSDSDSDSVPELESNDEPVDDLMQFNTNPLVSPTSNIIESLRKILKQTRLENEELNVALKAERNNRSELCALYDNAKEEIMGLHDLAASRANQIDGLIGENDRLQQKHNLAVHEVRVLRSDTKPSGVCDIWAREQIEALTKAISSQAQICDTQQKVVQNLKFQLDEVNLHGSQTNELAAACFDCLKLNGMIVGEGDTVRMVDKDKQDKATLVLQDVVQHYLNKKRDDAEWVVPEIGSG